MKENISPAKTAVSYGIIFGVIMILEFVIAYAFNIDGAKQPWVGIVNGLLNFLILPVLFILLACNNFKSKNGGYISFGECLKVSQ
jgi:K+ transporter